MRSLGRVLVVASSVLVVLLAVAGPAEGASDSSNVDYTSWSMRSIRPLPGTQVFGPHWSRDGRTMRFFTKSDRTNGGFDTIYATEPASGAGTRCLTCGLGHGFRMTSQTASQYAESPDGRWLAVETLGPVVESGQQTGLPCLVCADPGALGQVIDSNIAVLELDARGRAVGTHQLTFGGTDAANLRPTFTPDGRQVIWWANRSVRDNPPEEWKRWRIMIADFQVGADGKPKLANERVLIDRGGAVLEDGGITGDGGTYYFLKTVDHDPELFALDMRTGVERPFQLQVGWDEFPKPAPSARAVFFMSDRAYANLVCDPAWRTFPLTGEPSDADFLTVLFGTFVCGGLGEARPEQGPNGRPQVRAQYDAYVSDPSGRQVIRVTDRGNVGFASWSPDSSELALNRSEGADLDPDQIAIFTFASRAAGSPRLSVSLGYRRDRTRGGKRCARGAVRATLAGRDRRLVASVEFLVDDRRVARDRTAPFSRWIRARALPRGVRSVSARAALRDGRHKVVQRRLRSCG